MAGVCSSLQHKPHDLSTAAPLYAGVAVCLKSGEQDCCTMQALACGAGPHIAIASLLHGKPQGNPFEDASQQMQSWALTCAAMWAQQRVQCCSNPIMAGCSHQGAQGAKKRFHTAIREECLTYAFNVVIRQTDSVVECPAWPKQSQALKRCSGRPHRSLSCMLLDGGVLDLCTRQTAIFQSGCMADATHM